MDGSRFDDLTRTLAAGASRRRVLGALGGLAAAVLGRGPAQAAPSNCAVGCANLKGPQKAACGQACRQCGGDFNRVCVAEGPFGPTGFTCCPAGTFCVFGPGICCPEGADVCFDADGNATCCPEGTFCDVETGQCGPPAACDAASGCFGGACAQGCFCVTDTEGQGACVSGAFADCGAPPCETSAECGDGGHCVDATECCGGPTRVCFPAEAVCQPGGTGGAASRTGAPGWHR